MDEAVAPLIPWAEATWRQAYGKVSDPLQAEATDEDLIARAAQGDRPAFAELVERHGRFALRVAARLVPDRQAAEDLAQDAMLRAWTHAGRFDPTKARFRTWLYRIIVNLCIDHQRRHRPDRLPDGFDAPDPATGAEDMLAQAQRHAALAAALTALPPRQRAAMTLVYDEGLSGVETAHVLGLTAKAVERMLARARIFLRARLLDHAAPAAPGPEDTGS